jgi:hydroxyacyl-ACP dehydratase HTD2-like protein with hotdog domain
MTGLASGRSNPTPGQQPAELVVRPTALQLFRYSAVTWNSHRIHYDPAYATAEGHRGVLVQSHLHAALALRVVTEHWGPGWRVTAAAYRIRHSAAPGDTLRFTATIVEADDNRVRAELAEHNQDDVQCLEGTVELERRR